MLGQCLTNVRERKPLIHNITNYVTVNDVANVILACGASPIMADAPEDAEDITKICAGLNINLGTLNKDKAKSMLLAGRLASKLGHPILLDPVGVGSSHFRTETAISLLSEISFSVIRGNISEIRALYRKLTGEGARIDAHGVDADVKDVVTEENLTAMVSFVKAVAKVTKSIIVISGSIDLVSDENRCYCIYNGRSEMSRITGTGCQLSGLITSFITANPDHMLEATAAAVIDMGLAGELAYGHLAPFEGNATYRNRIIDAICLMEADVLEKGARYEVR